MKPSYATAVVGEHEVIEGVLEDDLGSSDEPCCEGCGGIHGIEDMLPGSAGKGATVGAAVGSFIPGVGTAVGGAVGAAAGAIADFVGGIGGKHCSENGHEIPCPNCAITDIQCLKNWAIARAKAKAAPNAPPGPSLSELVRRAQQQATAHAAATRPPPPRARRAPPPPPRPTPRPAPPRIEAPRIDAPHVEAEPESSVLPIALAAGAVLATGAGLWWWRKKQEARPSTRRSK